MKKTAISVGIAAAAIMLSQSALADRVKGGPKADFSNNELQVPCVQVEGYSEAADGQFFDIVLKRRGKSFNYELSFAEPEDPAVCEELANYAVFIDDDGESDDDEADEAEDHDEDADEGRKHRGDEVSDLFASCEVRYAGDEQTRSRVKVKAKNLEAGDYYAVITSGDNTLQSETRTIEEDEAEFKFDSSDDAVDEGAEAIEASFIVEDSLTAELFAADGEAALLSESVSCRVKD